MLKYCWQSLLLWFFFLIWVLNKRFCFPIHRLPVSCPTCLTGWHESFHDILQDSCFKIWNLWSITAIYQDLVQKLVFLSNCSLPILYSLQSIGNTDSFMRHGDPPRCTEIHRETHGDPQRSPRRCTVDLKILTRAKKVTSKLPTLPRRPRCFQIFFPRCCVEHAKNSWRVLYM